MAVPARDKESVNEPRITFGMIVLNGEPFLRYNLRALYPFAHQIIVVEGACPSAKGNAAEDGHSRDGTLQELRRFKTEEDPGNKLTIVIAEDEGRSNGFWLEKDEMSRAYAVRATGNYLWQVDCDEFYRPEDMRTVVEILAKDAGITAVSFPMLTFWGGLDYLVDGFFLRRFVVHRLFAWGNGYCYSSHRPPTVLDDKGRNLREIKHVTAAEMAGRGVSMFHYELLLPKQVKEKCEYYIGAQWLGGSYRELKSWMNSSYFFLERPFRPHMVFTHMSWLKRFNGTHPPQVNEMIRATACGKFPGIELRKTKDVESLLAKSSYSAARAILIAAVPLHNAAAVAKELLRKGLRGSLLFDRLWFLKAKISGTPLNITPNEISGNLVGGWKTPSIPAAQRKLTARELGDMYNNNVIRPWAALAEAVRYTKCEQGFIVEVGCSTGYHYEVLKYLLNQEINYMGIDYSKAMIEEARRLYPSIPFIVGDATSLPLGDHSYDILISGCVLLHVTDYHAAIVESSRVSRRWVILHKTPLAQGKTQYYRKYAYGVPCVEIHFNEKELFDICRSCGLVLRHEIWIQGGDDSQKTYVFERCPS